MIENEPMEEIDLIEVARELLLDAGTNLDHTRSPRQGRTLSVETVIDQTIALAAATAQLAHAVEMRRLADWLTRVDIESVAAHEEPVDPLAVPNILCALCQSAAIFTPGGWRHVNPEVDLFHSVALPSDDADRSGS